LDPVADEYLRAAQPPAFLSRQYSHYARVLEIFRSGGLGSWFFAEFPTVFLGNPKEKGYSQDCGLFM